MKTLLWIWIMDLCPLFLGILNVCHGDIFEWRHGDKYVAWEEREKKYYF